MNISPKDNPRNARERAAVRFISTRNAELVTGQSYRWNRDLAIRYGVPIIKIGSKWLIDAEALFRALEQATANDAPLDPIAAVELAMGARR